MRVPLIFDESSETAETILGLLPGDMQFRRRLGVADTPDAEDIEARAGQAAINFPKVHSKSLGWPQVMVLHRESKPVRIISWHGLGPPK